MSSQIKRSIGILEGVAYCVTIMIGAGILSLPGIAYQLSGPSATLAWALDLLLMLPLLFVFSRLMARTQSAGGLSDFVRLAFGSGLVFHFSQVLLVITLVVGTSAIALVGADYLSQVSAHFAPGRALGAILLVLVPTMINSLGLRLGTRLQYFSAASLVLFLVLVMVFSVPVWKVPEGPLLGPVEASSCWTAMSLVWFAFTGIEQLSFLGEDFRSSRTFIVAVGAGFILVGALYLGMAITVQMVLSPTDPALVRSPLVALLEAALGPAFSRYGALFSALIIFVNLNGSIFSASRLIFSVGREGRFLPSSFGRLDQHGVAQVSLWSLADASMVLTVLVTQLELGLTRQLHLVSQNWFILYVLAIMAFIAVERSRLAFLIGLLCLAVTIFFMKSFSWLLLVPGGVFVILLALEGGRRLRKGREEDVGEQHCLHKSKAM